MPRSIRGRLGAGVVVCLAVVTALAFACCAVAGTAQCAGDHGSKKHEHKPAPQKPVSAEQATDDKAVPGATPKLVCAAASITLDPIWAGQPLAATWVIKNEGEADLTIKIKKG